MCNVSRIVALGLAGQLDTSFQILIKPFQIRTRGEGMVQILEILEFRS